ncbi:MAG: hemolysin family protein [Saprospiraceae bacterium]
MLVVGILLSIVLSAIFSGSEIAFISANKLRVELKKKRGSKRGLILAKFFENPSDFLSTMLVGNNVALVIFTSLMTLVLNPYIAPWVSGEYGLLLVNTLIITVVILILGEFLPKTFFRLFADDILFFLAYPLRILKFILAIPSWFMFKTSNFLLTKVLRTPMLEVEETFTRLDLEDFIKSTRTDAEEEIDTELFEKALNLHEVRVKECMVPRTEIIHIDISATVDELAAVFQETKMSRIIVVKDDIDNVIGYVHHQQMFKNPRSIKGILLEIEFVPEVMRVRDAMNTFIKNRLNVACVVDEFGGTAGLITLEDIVEEIFGEIDDEHDQEDLVEEQISDDEFLFSGRLEIDYINERYGLFLPEEGEYSTLSGYLVMTMGDIPEENVEIILGEYKFILESVSNTKIETVRVLKHKEEND